MGEGADTKLPVLVAERGMLPTRLRVRGTPSHGSMPFMTDNALVKAGRICQLLADHRPQPVIDEAWQGFVDGFGLDPGLTGPLKDPEGFNDICALLPPGLGRVAFSCTHTTIAPTMISAGSKLNIIPGEIELGLDVRTLPGHGPEAVWEQIQDALGPSSRPTSTSCPVITCRRRRRPREPPCGIRWNGPARPSIREARSLRSSCRAPPTRAGGDRSSARTCYGFGLFSRRMNLEQMGTMGHGDDERIDVESLQLVHAYWKELARDFLR